MIVGDPLQIEPVVTAPRKLVECLGGNRGMDDQTIRRWSPSVQSAQTLADRTMRLGAQIGDVWTGLPLRTHRRCMNPMFEIANRIAYDEQMVQATASKDVQPDLFASCWIDVRGKAHGKVVDNEIETLRRILDSFLLEWPQVVNSKGEKAAASVYVISVAVTRAQQPLYVIGNHADRFYPYQWPNRYRRGRQFDRCPAGA